jgi:hypothetical protein
VILFFAFWKTKAMPGNGEVVIKPYYESWTQRFNVHSSPKYRLVYEGCVFNDITGRSPYYIQIPSIHAIMFAQRMNSGQRIIVFYDDGKIINFDDVYNSFLVEIGGRDFVGCNASNLGIELKYNSNGVHDTYWFDIPTRQISKKYN